jgi:hypothetical protein
MSDRIAREQLGAGTDTAHPKAPDVAAGRVRVCFVPSMLPVSDAGLPTPPVGGRSGLWRLHSAILSSAHAVGGTSESPRPVVVFGSLRDLPPGSTVFVADQLGEPASDVVRALVEDPLAPLATFGEEGLRFLDSLADIGIRGIDSPGDGDDQ